MKKLFIIMLLAATLFGCNNEDSTDTTRTDSTVIERDNTINMDTSIRTDTGMNMNDTLNR